MEKEREKRRRRGGDRQKEIFRSNQCRFLLGLLAARGCQHGTSQAEYGRSCFSISFPRQRPAKKHRTVRFIILLTTLLCPALHDRWHSPASAVVEKHLRACYVDMVQKQSAHRPPRFNASKMVAGLLRTAAAVNNVCGRGCSLVGSLVLCCRLPKLGFLTGSCLTPSWVFLQRPVSVDQYRRRNATCTE